MEFSKFKRAGALLRAKMANFEENEVNIAYVSKIEQLRGESNTITSLVDNEGIIKSGSENVLKITHDFYSNLYKRSEEDINEQNYFFRNINIKLNREERDSLDEPFTNAELLKALEDLKSNKSPGDDSVTKELLLFFWNELSPIYLRAILEIKQKQELCPSQKRGLITIAYKKMEESLLRITAQFLC